MGADDLRRARALRQAQDFVGLLARSSPPPARRRRVPVTHPGLSHASRQTGGRDTSLRDGRRPGRRLGKSAKSSRSSGRDSVSSAWPRIGPARTQPLIARCRDRAAFRSSPNAPTIARPRGRRTESRNVAPSVAARASRRSSPPCSPERGGEADAAAQSKSKRAEQPEHAAAVAHESRRRRRRPCARTA